MFFHALRSDIMANILMSKESERDLERIGDYIAILLGDIIDGEEYL